MARFPAPVSALAAQFDQVGVLSAKSPKKEAAVLGPFQVAEHKPGAYVLGDATTPITVETIDRAWRVVKVAAAITAALVLTVLRVSRGL